MHYFLTGTGTDIGKTYILEQICKNWQKNGIHFNAIKPVISGFNKNDKNSDLHKILKILGKDFTQENFHEISLYQFKAPLSPNIAAKKEEKEINYQKVVNFCQEKIAKFKNENLIIEGAGGLMSPISDDKTFLDLIKILQIPVILVCGNYLGTISHSLCAIEILKQHKIPIAKIILNCKKDDKIDYQENLKMLESFSEMKVLLH